MRDYFCIHCKIIIFASGIMLRMVVAGRRMAKGIFADTAKVFRFDVAFNLTQEEVFARF